MGSLIDLSTAILGAAVLGLAGISAWTWWKVRNIALASSKRHRALLAELRSQYSQLEALLALYYDLRPSSALPSTRGMAASPDFLRILSESVRERQPQRILELGSGVSTVIIAMGLAHNGKGHLWSIDHDGDYAQATQHLVARRELAEWVSVVHVPLRPLKLDGEDYSWYDPALIPHGSFDLIVVDGPPVWSCRDARYPTVPVLGGRLSDQGAILLDDADRAPEAEAIKRWLMADSTLTARRIRAEKGCLIIEQCPAEQSSH